MPLPLAPLVPLAVRLGLVASTTWALTRWVRSSPIPAAPTSGPRTRSTSSARD
jgi:hypothetical protein